MKKLNALISISCVTAIAFYGLSAISHQNEFTSVRKYAKTKAVIETTSASSETNAQPKTETVSAFSESNSEILTEDTSNANIQEYPSSTEMIPAEDTSLSQEDTLSPTIEFLDYEDGQIVHTSSIDIRVAVSDNISQETNIRVQGTGRYELKIGFNPIVVSAYDEAGNETHEYIIIERIE